VLGHGPGYAWAWIGADVISRGQFSPIIPARAGLEVGENDGVGGCPGTGPAAGATSRI
jgi:hypothetical protein